MRKEISPNLFTIIIVITISLLLIVYFRYYYKEKQVLSNKLKFIKLLVISVILIGFCLVFSFQIIQVYIVIGAEGLHKGNLLFTLLNGLIFGMYLNILGFTLKSERMWIKALLIFTLIWLFTNGFGGFGIYIKLNAPLDSVFLYTKYQTNSVLGIRFFINNILLLSTIFISSFLIESEV